MRYVKNILIWGAILGLFYFVLGNHFIIMGSGIKLLKKSSLTLNYTIFSTNGKTNQKILDVDELREDGVGDLLVEAGHMTDAEYERLMMRYEGEET